MIEWREGYTGGLAYAFQSEWEGYVNNEYKYAIQIYPSDKLYTHAEMANLKPEITLYVVTYCDYHSCNGIWDYCDIEVSEDGNDSCEVGYCLTKLNDYPTVGIAQEYAQKHLQGLSIRMPECDDDECDWCK